jgi:hypothetical protein
MLLQPEELKLLVGSPKPDRSTGKGQRVVHWSSKLGVVQLGWYPTHIKIIITHKLPIKNSWPDEQLLQEEKDKRFGIAEHITLGTWNI